MLKLMKSIEVTVKRKVNTSNGIILNQNQLVVIIVK